MLGIKKLLDMEKPRFLPSSPEEVGTEHYYAFLATLHCQRSASDHVPLLVAFARFTSYEFESSIEAVLFVFANSERRCWYTPCCCSAHGHSSFGITLWCESLWARQKAGCLQGKLPPPLADPALLKPRSISPGCVYCFSKLDVCGDVFALRTTVRSAQPTLLQ